MTLTGNKNEDCIQCKKCNEYIRHEIYVRHIGACKGKKSMTNTAEYLNDRRQKRNNIDIYESVGRHGSGKSQTSLLLNKKQKIDAPPDPNPADCRG